MAVSPSRRSGTSGAIRSGTIDILTTGTSSGTAWCPRSTLDIIGRAWPAASRRATSTATTATATTSGRRIYYSRMPSGTPCHFHLDAIDAIPNMLISAQVPNEEHSLVDEVGRAGQRNQTHYHRHYYDGDQLHMRWETATPEKRIRPMVDALPADPSLIARRRAPRNLEETISTQGRSASRPVNLEEGARWMCAIRCRDKLKNSVAFSGNAQTAAVRLRHAFKRHARRGVSAGGGALLLLGARGMVGSGAGAVAAPTDVGQVLRELGVELDESELEALLGEVQGNAVPVEAVVRDVARCVAGVC